MAAAANDASRNGADNEVITAQTLSVGPVHRRQRSCARLAADARQHARQARLAPSRDVENGGADGERDADAAVIVLGEPTALLDEEATLLRSYIVQAGASSEAHYAAADRNRCTHRTLSVIHKVLLALTAGGSILYNIFTSDTTMRPYSITLNVLLLVAAIIAAVQSVFRFDERSVLHEMSGDDFLNYTREWCLRMVRGVDDRRSSCLVAMQDALHRLQAIELHSLPMHRTKATKPDNGV